MGPAGDVSRTQIRSDPAETLGSGEIELGDSPVTPAVPCPP